MCECMCVCSNQEMEIKCPLCPGTCARDKKKFSTSFQSTWRAGKYNQDSEKSRTVVPKVGINAMKFQRRE